MASSCVALAGLAASCTVGVGTPPDEYAAEHRQEALEEAGDGGAVEDVDLLVDGAQGAIDDLRAEIGGEQIQAYLVSMSSDTVFLEVPADESGQSDRYKWDPADGVTSLGTRPVSAAGIEPFALNSVDFGAIPDLVDQAPAEAGIQGEVTSSVDIRRSGGQTLVTVSMVTPRGDAAAVVADADGQIIGSS